MTQQAESRDVGERVHLRQLRELRAGRIEPGGAGDHGCVAGGIEFVVLERRALDAHTEPFAEDDRIARPRAHVALEVLRVHQSDGHEPVDRFHRIDAVTARYQDAGPGADRFGTKEDVADGGHRQPIGRHAHQRQGEQ